MHQSNEVESRQGLAIALILLGSLARVLPHPENVAPLTAMALFGGVYLSRRWAIAIPLGAVVLSDLILGIYDSIAFTWGAFALVGLLGWWLRREPSVGRMTAAALAGSCLFFLITNFGVWLIGDGGAMYPKTLGGLWQCYVAALPFYRNTVLGDLAYTFGLFGLYAWVAKTSLCPSPIRTSSS